MIVLQPIEAGEICQVTLEMLSDWHIGTGHTGGDRVDRAVARDHDGLPYVPARSLWGVWRDACEQVALGLDGGSPASWSEWVTWLFGSQPTVDGVRATAEGPAPPLAAALTLSAARFEEAQRPFLRHPAIVPSVTVVRSGVAIDRDTGAARPNHLRRFEVAPVGARLHATLVPEQHLPTAAVALLAAGASQVDHLGGIRRRGLGRCELTLDGAATSSAIRAVRALGPSVDPPPRRAGAPATGTWDPLAAVDHVAESDWVTATIDFEARGPVRLPSRTIGNVGLSRPRIPGATIIALLQRTAPFALTELLASGALRVGDGIPVGPDGAPLLPSPRSIGISKVAGPSGQAVAQDLLTGADGPVRRLPADAGVTLQDGQLVAVTPRRKTVDHNSITDDMQRPTTDQGGLYSYEVHETGSRWRSDIIMSATAADQLRVVVAGVEGTARIGASRKDDYGLVNIQVAPATPLTGATPTGTATKLRVLLTSDALLLDAALRPDPTPAGLAVAIASALGRPADGIVATRALTTATRTESWHSRWGLPRPTLALLAAGSVLELAAEPSVDVRLLAQLGHIGVGERVAEGFGRFVVNPDVLTTPIGHPLGSASPLTASTPDAPIPEPDGDFGVRIGVRALLQAARRAGEEQQLAPDLNGNDLKGLRRTQLGALRSVLTAPDWQQATRDWLAGIARTENRAKKWPAALRMWIGSVVEDPAPVVRWLGNGWPDAVTTQAAHAIVPTYLGELVRTLHRRGPA